MKWLLRPGKISAAAGLLITLGLVVPQSASATPDAGRADSVSPAQPAAASQAGWRIIYRARIPMSLLAVAALNPRNAWAVGYTDHGYAVALQFLSGRWHRRWIPAADHFYPQYIAGSGATNVWMLGYRNTATGQAWQVLRWNGQAWHQLPAPPEAGVPNEVGFLVLGPSNVWFPSEGSCGSSGGVTTCSTPVCRWNGRTWDVYHLNGMVTGLATSGPGNIWAVGYRRPMLLAGRNARPVTYRWTGTAWRAVGMPGDAITGFHNGGPVIDTAGPRNVWIGSEAEDKGGGALLMHWDGRRWYQHRLPVIGGTAVIDPPRGTWTSPWGYWTGHRWVDLNIPSWMNTVSYLARVPLAETMLATGGTILAAGGFRAEIFSYGTFG